MKALRPVLPNCPAPGAENCARWAELKNQISPEAESRNGVPSPRLQPLQLAVVCTTLLTVLLPANTVNGRPLVTRPYPVTSQPPTIRSASPEAPVSQRLPLPKGNSVTKFHWRTCRRSKSEGA